MSAEAAFGPVMPLREFNERAVVKLATERKHLTDIIKNGCLSGREVP